MQSCAFPPLAITNDALGRKTSETAPDGSTISYEYDLQGRLTKKTVGNNAPETYTYDVFDNLISKQRDGESISYTYNAVGARTSMTDSTGTTNYAYDPFGNLTTEAKNGIVKSYTYDVLGNRTSFNAANGESSVIGNTYAYDNMGRLTSVTNGADTVSYTYDANSNRLSTAVNGTVTNTATYNKGNLPVEIKNFDGGTLVDTTAFAYYFDGNVRNQVVTTANDSTSTNYRYDGVGRLTKERTYSESYTFDYTNEYFYDNYGNRRIFMQTDDQKNTKTSVKYTFDSKNKLVKSHFSCYNSDTSQTRSVNTNYTYDDFGNTVSVTENDELAKTYTYDAFNRLSTYTADGVTASYTYDGDNLRQSKTVNGSTVNHLLDGANVVADIRPDSTNIYVYGNGVELFKTGGQTSRYTKSYRGDVTAVTTGDTKTEYFYDAFGNKQTDTDTSTNPFEYCGEYFDDETGLIYLRNRYYDPTIGRFITEDPARDGENWYVYAGNNPVSFVDPNGLDAIVITTSTMSVYGNAHTSVLVQDNGGIWYYFYWGNKNAVLLEVPADKLTDLDTFNAWLVENGAGKDGKKTDKPLHDSSDKYTTGTYIEGDFSASVSYFLEQAKGANMAEKIKNGKHEYKNNSYGLFGNNCMTVSFDGLKKGTLPDGTNFGDFAKFDGADSIRPNDFRVMVRETFANQEFTKSSARNSAIGNMGVKKPWYMSQNYYDQCQKYGKMLRGY